MVEFFKIASKEKKQQQKKLRTGELGHNRTETAEGRGLIYLGEVSSSKWVFFIQDLSLNVYFYLDLFLIGNSSLPNSHWWY